MSRILAISFIMSMFGCNAPTEGKKASASAEYKNETPQTQMPAPPETSSAESKTRVPPKAVAKPNESTKKKEKPRRSRNRFAVKANKPALPPSPAANRPRRFSPGSHAKFNELKDSAVDGQPVEDKGAPKIERLDDDRIKIGQVIANRQTREVIIPGHVNMTAGILEYFAVAPQGKTHESVITYEGFASHVHLALLLVGLEPKPQQPDLLDLTLKWVDPYTKKNMETVSGQWMMDRKSKAAPKRLPWGFTGSSFWNGRYAGDSSHCLISLIQDANCTIVLQDRVENPYQGDNMGYEVHTQLIPPRGTALTLVITPKK